MSLSPQFRPVRFEEVPGWRADDHAAAFAAFRLCALETRAYKTGSLGVRAEAFKDAFAAAKAAPALDGEAARFFFERHFLPCRIATEGFVTGYYEPQVEASTRRTARFYVPLLAPPPDLVKIDDDNRPPHFDSSFAFGRRTPDGVVEYFDRAAIGNGAIEGVAEPIAWLADPVDAFFIHVQGSARLLMEDGIVRRITYAAKTGHPFTGPGRVLAEKGEIPREAVTMQSIRAWLATNPGRVNEILNHNRSYIFFREAPVEDPALGPVAAARVPLTPGRSLAVDRLLHTFATPFFIDAPTLDAFGHAPFRRLMVAQDTGSAIVGQARGDLFAGCGDAAGEIAGVIRHKADFYALVPCAQAVPA